MSVTTDRGHRHYDRLAAFYDVLWPGYVGRTLEALLARMPAEAARRILDVGCGTGELEALLVARNSEARIVGADPSERMLARARKKLGAYENVDFVAARAEHLPFEAESFDLVLSANALHYFADAAAAFAEMGRVLAPGGRVVVVDWCRESATMRAIDALLRIIEPAYVRSLTRDEILEMAGNAGLTVEKADVFRVHQYGMMSVVARRT